MLALLSFLVLAVLVAALAAVHVPGVCLGLKKAGALLALRLSVYRCTCCLVACACARRGVGLEKAGALLVLLLCSYSRCVS